MRLFAGIWPPPDAIATLAKLERPDLAGVRWVLPAQWHVTVRFFGEVDAADVSGLIDRLSAVASRLREEPPVHATLGPRVGRLGSRLLAVEVGGLEDLAEEIRLATLPLADSAAGSDEDERPFLGHLTLARCRQGAKLSDVLGQPVSASWAVEDLALIASELGPGGARYHDVIRLPLAPQLPGT